MDILVEAIMNRTSDTTMIGKTITAPDITMRSLVAATAAALPTAAALVAGMEEDLVVVMAEASAAAMVAVVEATAVAAGIVSRETVQLGRSDHA